MRTVISGSRSIYDYALLRRAVADSGFTITSVVCGMACGVDMMGYRWAREHSIPIAEFKPEWTKYGKVAGHLRNFEMAANADQAVILWNGVSTGTKSMIEWCRKCQVKVHLVRCERPDTLVKQGQLTVQAATPTSPLDFSSYHGILPAGLRAGLASPTPALASTAGLPAPAQVPSVSAAPPPPTDVG